MEFTTPKGNWLQPTIRYLFRKTPRNWLVSLLVENNNWLNEEVTAITFSQFSLVELWRSVLWNDCKVASHLIHWWYDSSSFHRKNKFCKIWNLNSNACHHQNWTMPQTKPNSFEKSWIPWTHCFQQMSSTSCQKGPRPKKSEEPWKQERCNLHLRKFRFLQYIHRELACGFKTFFMSSWEMMFPSRGKMSIRNYFRALKTE